MIITRVGRLSTYLYRGAQRYLSNVIQTSNDKIGSNIVWLDMEMTGLDVEKCHILEIACLITDERLKPMGDSMNIVIHQSNEILENMSDWCKVQHRKNGLINECRSSKITLDEAQRRTLRYLEDRVPRAMCPLAGNSVYMDRIFLQKYMPLVEDYLHYRIIDVSSIADLARRWRPEIYKEAPKKQYLHRAAIDIEDSLKELHYFKKRLFISEKFE